MNSNLTPVTLDLPDELIAELTLYSPGEKIDPGGMGNDFGEKSGQSIARRFHDTTQRKPSFGKSSQDADNPGIQGWRTQPRIIKIYNEISFLRMPAVTRQLSKP